MSNIGKIDMTVPAWTNGDNYTVPLTIKELQLMHLLKSAPANTKKIMDTLWGPKDSREVSNKTLHVHVHNLRSKLEHIGIGLTHTEGKYQLHQLKIGKKRV